MQLSI